MAIAKKIISALNGQIWCESDPQRGVEFYFTLPRSHELIDPRTQLLPASSTEIKASFERLRKDSQAFARLETHPLEVSLEAEVIKLLKSVGEPLKVLVVDDEAVYRNSLAALLNQSNDLKKPIVLSFAQNSKEALEAGRVGAALIILDVDLGVDLNNGYEVLRMLRSQGHWGVICIHSNRTSTEDYKIAVDAGADAVLPKPMSRTHFLKLLLQSAERAQLNGSLSAVPPETLPEFALLDDSNVILRAWQRKMAKHALVHVFSSPAEFWNYVASNEDFLSRLAFVVTDFYFAEGVMENGIAFAEKLKTQFRNPVLLCSNGDFSIESIGGIIDKVLPKTPLSWEELSVHLEVIKLARTNSEHEIQ